MKNSSKIWKFVWLIGLYANLFIILYLVVTYKVKWEYKDLNTYLYFYECDHQLCTSNVPVDNYYNKIICNDGYCPYIDVIIDNKVIMKNNSKTFLYDYVKGEIINNIYMDYHYIGNNMYIVKDENGKYGVIDDSGKILVNFEFSFIDNYQNGLISYMENNLYGIASDNNKYNFLPKYEDVVLINENIYAGKLDNLYRIYSYDSNAEYNMRYNFVYSTNNVIFAVSDSKIDILDVNLNSILLMKVDTYFKYTTEQERDSLDIYSDGEYIYFKVFINDFEYNKYKYNLNDKKLIRV